MMKILECVEEFKDTRQPLVLTIGNFDGMHRGHTAILKKVKELAAEEGQSVVLTFRNHPSEILRPQHPVKLISPLPQKILQLQNSAIDQLILMNFTSYLANRSAASFIETLRQTIPFSHLVLGHDATLGRDKQGDRATMNELADLWGFTIYYLEDFRYEATPVSSSRIREALLHGNLDEVEALLGRPYSLYVPVISHKTTADHSNIIQLDVSGLCLPPSGTYAIQVRVNSQAVPGIAILKGDETGHSLEVKFQDQLFLLDSLEVIFLNLECGDSSPLS